MTAPMTPARVAAIAACAAEAPLHLDPQEVLALCEAWRDGEETFQKMLRDPEWTSAQMAEDMAHIDRLETGMMQTQVLLGEAVERAEAAEAGLSKTVWCTKCGDQCVHDGDDNWCWVCVGEAKRRIEAAEADRARLRAALEAVLPVTCDDVHHDKRDRHGFDEPCPVLARAKVALGLGGGQ